MPQCPVTASSGQIAPEGEGELGDNLSRRGVQPTGVSNGASDLVQTKRSERQRRGLKPSRRAVMDREQVVHNVSDSNFEAMKQAEYGF